MSILFRYVWGSKLCLIGWSTYRSCVTQDSPFVICGISLGYLVVLFVATAWTWKDCFYSKKLDTLETEYLQQLEEGLGIQKKKDE